MLNPVVNWLQRRHRLIKRPLAIVLTYLGLVVALLFVVGLLLPILVDQFNSLINFGAAVANAPEGPTEYLKGLAQQYGFGWVFERFSEQLGDVRDEEDTKIASVTFRTEGLPEAVDTLVPIARVGAVVSPPPKGTWWGRIAYATAVADSFEDCEQAINSAQSAIEIRTA